jgi:integrase/uncharacterized protein YsxB (DUF464 family)
VGGMMKKLKAQINAIYDVNRTQLELLTNILRPFHCQLNETNLIELLRELSTLYLIIVNEYEDSLSEKNSLLIEARLLQEYAGIAEDNIATFPILVGMLQVGDLSSDNLFLEYLLGRQAISEFDKAMIDVQSYSSLLTVADSNIRSKCRDYRDEEWSSEYDLMIKNEYRHLQVEEQHFVISFIQRALDGDIADENARLAGNALALLILTSSDEISLKRIKIYADAHERVGICLTRGVFIRDDFVPSGAFKQGSDSSDMLCETRHRIAFPLPTNLLKSIKQNYSAELNEHECISMDQIVPSSKLLWKMLYRFDDQKALLGGRNGFRAFRTVLYYWLVEKCDRDVASLIIGHAEFSSRHHQYYLSHPVQQSIDIWCAAVSELFQCDVPPIKIDVPKLYHGSEVMVAPDSLKARHIELKSRLDTLWAKKYTLTKDGLIELNNLASSVAAFSFAINCALRKQKTIGDTLSLSNMITSDFIRLSDKTTPKYFNRRKIPLTDFTRQQAANYEVIRDFVFRRLDISATSATFAFLQDDCSVTELSTSMMYQILFPGHQLPENLSRQLMATLCRHPEIAHGQYAIVLLGHENDKYNLQLPTMLAEPLDIALWVEKIQTQILAISPLPKCNRHRSRDTKEKCVEALLMQDDFLTITKELLESNPLFQLSATELANVVASNEPIRALGDLMILQDQKGHRWILNDEWQVLINKIRSENLVNSIKRAWGGTIGNLHILPIEHPAKLLTLSKPLSDASFYSLISGQPYPYPLTLQSRTPSMHHASDLSLVNSLIKDLKSKGAQTKSRQCLVIKDFLMANYDCSPEWGESLEQLFENMARQFTSIDYYSCKFLIHLITKSRKNQGIKLSTIEDYAQFFNWLDLFCTDIDFEEFIETPKQFKVNLFSFIHSSKQYKNYSNSTKVGLNNLCKRFLRMLFGSDEIGINKWGRMQPNVDANMITEHEFQRLLHSIEVTFKDSPMSKSHHLGYAIVMYRLGLRESEARHLRVDDYQPHVNRIRVHSRLLEKLKSPHANRILTTVDFIPENELKILEDCVAYAHRSGFTNAMLFGSNIDVNEIRYLLKSASNNPNSKLHHLRHSYANYYYMALMAVDTPFVRAYFGDKPISAIKAELINRWTFLGYESYALHALSRSLGHSLIATTFIHYIHTVDIVTSFHNQDGRLLNHKQIAALAGILANTYNKKLSRQKKMDYRGFVSGLSTRNVSEFVFPQRSDIGENVEHNLEQFQLAKKWIKNLTSQFESYTQDNQPDSIQPFKKFGLLNQDYTFNPKKALKILCTSRFLKKLIFLLEGDRTTMMALVDMWCDSVGHDGTVLIVDRLASCEIFLDLGYEFDALNNMFCSCAETVKRNREIGLLLYSFQQVALRLKLNQNS